MMTIITLVVVVATNWVLPYENELTSSIPTMSISFLVRSGNVISPLMNNYIHNSHLFIMSVLAWNATSIAHLPSTFLTPLLSTTTACICSWNFSHTLTINTIESVTNSIQVFLCLPRYCREHGWSGFMQSLYNGAFECIGLGEVDSGCSVDGPVDLR